MASLPCFLVLPGSAFDHKIMVGREVIQQLMASGFIEGAVSEGIRDRHFAWTEHLSADERMQALLCCLPDGKQKQNLVNRFFREGPENLLSRSSSSSNVRAPESHALSGLGMEQGNPRLQCDGPSGFRSTLSSSSPEFQAVDDDAACLAWLSGNEVEQRNHGLGAAVDNASSLGAAFGNRPAVQAWLDDGRGMEQNSSSRQGDGFAGLQSTSNNISDSNTAVLESQAVDDVCLAWVNGNEVEPRSDGIGTAVANASSLGAACVSSALRDAMSLHANHGVHAANEQRSSLSEPGVAKGISPMSQACGSQDGAPMDNVVSKFRGMRDSFFKQVSVAGVWKSGGPKRERAVDELLSNPKAVLPVDIHDFCSLFFCISSSFLVSWCLAS